MQRDVIFAGFGGQGIMLAGQILAYAGMDEGMEVTWLPSYGPEMRGGSAYCTVIVSDKSISSPVISTPEIAVFMNRPSLEKFAGSVRPGGYIFINSSLVDITSGRSDVSEVPIPCNRIAEEVGSPKSANIAMLGALVCKTQIISTESISRRIKYTFSHGGAKVIDANLNAFRKGMQAAGVKR